MSGARSLRSPKGTFLENGQEVADTHMCCHCGRHWVFRAGSGKRRGWCFNCNSMHCGRKECSSCIPFMKKIEEIEAGKRRSILIP